MIRSCSRVVEADPCKAIVVPASGKELSLELRNEDISWNKFLNTVRDIPQ